jgi:hypothetical protein
MLLNSIILIFKMKLVKSNKLSSSKGIIKTRQILIVEITRMRKNKTHT